LGLGGRTQALGAVVLRRGPEGSDGLSASKVMALGVLAGLLALGSLRVGGGGELLAFIALTPVLFCALRGIGAGALAGLCAGLVSYGAALCWLPAVLGRFESMSLVQAWLVFVVGVAYHGVQFVLFGVGAGVMAAVWRRAPECPRHGLAWIATVASLWVVLEWGYPGVVSWPLGGVMASNVFVRQAADLGGVYGLAFAATLLSATLALALQSTSRSYAPRLAVVVVAGLTCSLGTYGFWHVSSHESVNQISSVAVAIVQGAVPAWNSSGDLRAPNAWDIYERLTIRAISDASARDQTLPELIVWPETTLPVFLRDDTWPRARMERFVNGLGRPVLVGALDRAEIGFGAFNSAYLFQSNPVRRERDVYAKSVQVYHKSVLLPWAEYVPGGRWLSFMRRWRTTGEFTPGTERNLFVVEGDRGSAVPLRLAPSICFEVLQPGWFNSMVRSGASMLVNITDDAWLADTEGPQLHLQLARLRAVETRRWLVRASNSGISAVIDPTGEIVAAIPFGEPGTLMHLVTPSVYLTPYVRFGDWVVWMSCTIMIVATAVVAASERRSETVS